MSRRKSFQIKGKYIPRDVTKRTTLHPLIVGSFFGGLGFLFYKAVASAFELEDSATKETDYVDPKAVEADSKKDKSKMALLQLIPPLSLPLRKPTPHGHYHDRRPTDEKQKFDHLHQGVDLAGHHDEPIFAVGDGKIVDSDPGKGQIVRVLLLKDGRAVVYADLGEAIVNPGRVMKAGEIIGKVRGNGFVHMAIRESRWGKFIDPTGVIPYDSDKHVEPLKVAEVVRMPETTKEEVPSALKPTTFSSPVASADKKTVPYLKPKKS